MGRIPRDMLPIPLDRITSPDTTDNTRILLPRCIGKTTIVKKFNGEDITTIEPTLGFDIKTLEYRGYQLNCWDIGGQQTIRSYWRNYFEQTDGLIWVVDSGDKLRLEDCKKEL